MFICSFPVRGLVPSYISQAHFGGRITWTRWRVNTGSEGRDGNGDGSQVSDSCLWTLPSFYQADKTSRQPSPHLSSFYPMNYHGFSFLLFPIPGSLSPYLVPMYGLQSPVSSHPSCLLRGVAQSLILILSCTFKFASAGIFFRLYNKFQILSTLKQSR